MSVDSILAELRRRVDQRVKAAALVLQAEHKKDLSVHNPPPHKTPSRPGEFPKFRTLNLRDSVAIQKIKSGHYRVGYWPGAWYIVPLHERKRKTVADTADRIRVRLNKIISGGT